MPPLQQLPSVDRLLQAQASQLLIEQFGRGAVLASIRAVLAIQRQALRQQPTLPVADDASLLAQVAAHLAERFHLSLRPVINATGLLLHTNLGRAPLADAAITAMQAAAQYSSLEYDLASGERGDRYSHLVQSLCELTGAEAALVVNNGAAAVLLMLSALTAQREVIISRGQLVEIGGSFRVPDVMAQSQAQLVEVGTTNRTRLADYESAIGPATAALMRAHPSNFRVLGFTEEVPLDALAALAQAHNLLCLDDLGSGALLDTAQFGLRHEPTVQESLAAGADVVAFSGDKLLGGPQAGILLGRAALISRLRRHPLARALRVDKLTLAALAATLDLYRRERALAEIPIWRMMALSLQELEALAQGWAEVVPGELLPGESTIGGGSLPGESLPTCLFAPRVSDPQQAQATLRQGSPPIITRVKENRLLLDPRSVLPDQVALVAQRLQAL